MHYELYMTAALAEAQEGTAIGERPDGAVAVLDEAMVARGHNRVRETGDPTAHAVVVTIREAAKRLGTPSLEGVTVFAAVEPCAMCVGALLESDADALVYAVPDPVAGAAGSAVQLTNGDALDRRLRVVSGIMQTEAADVVGSARRPAAGRSAR